MTTRTVDYRGVRVAAMPSVGVDGGFTVMSGSREAAQLVALGIAQVALSRVYLSADDGWDSRLSQANGVWVIDMVHSGVPEVLVERGLNTFMGKLGDAATAARYRDRVGL